jgi:hypothetical protein
MKVEKEKEINKSSLGLLDLFRFFSLKSFYLDKKLLFDGVFAL